MHIKIEFLQHIKILMFTIKMGFSEEIYLKKNMTQSLISDIYFYIFLLPLMIIFLEGLVKFIIKYMNKTDSCVFTKDFVKIQLHLAEILWCIPSNTFQPHTDKC